MKGGEMVGVRLWSVLEGGECELWGVESGGGAGVSGGAAARVPPEARLPRGCASLGRRSQQACWLRCVWSHAHRAVGVKAGCQNVATAGARSWGALPVDGEQGSSDGRRRRVCSGDVNRVCSMRLRERMARW